MTREHSPFTFLLSVLLACLSACAWAQDQGAARRAEAVRRAFSKHPVPGARVGIAVTRLADGKTIFSHDAATPLHLASNAKLFTTAAALWKLGADYQFRTAVIANGRIERGTLNGDLVIVGGGDPTISGRFSGDRMHVPKQIAAAVRQFKIQRITGDLVMDDRLFDRVLRAPGWPKAELLWWYTAPVSALSFNDNCLDIAVTGAAGAGKPARIKVRPDVKYARVINRCTTGGSRKTARVTFARGERGAVIISGRIAPKQTRSENITVTSPPLFLAAAIRTSIEELGIRIAGRSRLVRDGEKARPEAREIFAVTTPLTRAVTVANQRSQNFYAEQILKTLGAARTGVGTFQSGVRAIEEFLKAAAIPPSAVTLADGCGLSPENRASPQAIVTLLRFMYESEFKDIFFNSLAAGGLARTSLRNRMTQPPMKGRIHAKTGTVQSRGLSALSGYAEALDGHLYAFSLLTDGFRSGQLYKARQMENALCHALVGVPEKKPRKKPR